MTKNIIIVGAGQIGSRHLQALKRVKFPLNITVVDPSEQSLATAKQRYGEMSKGKYIHVVNYIQGMPAGPDIDLAIVATTSDVRAKVVKNILKKNEVRYFILEKVLFDKKGDYAAIAGIFSKSNIKAWVNLPRRIRPVYKKIKEELTGKAISVRGVGSQWSLASNSIHLLDLAAYLTGENVYKVDTNFLDKKILPSKRKGFLEVRGTLRANFANGSSCELVSYVSGDAPFLVEISGKEGRYIIREADGNGWVSGPKSNWQWKEIKFKDPLISETTTDMVENILEKGSCPLTPYEEAAKTHISLLEPLRQFLNKNSVKKYEYYPFT